MKLNSLFENFSSHLHKAETESSDADSDLAAQQTKSTSDIDVRKFMELLAENLTTYYSGGFDYSEYQHGGGEYYATFGRCYIRIEFPNSQYLSLFYGDRTGNELRFYNSEITDKNSDLSSYFGTFGLMVLTRRKDKIFNQYLKLIHKAGFIEVGNDEKNSNTYSPIFIPSYKMLDITVKFLINLIDKHI